MNTTNDGGPAFPRAGTDTSYSQEGMSLRDWFAGQETLADLDSPEASVPKWAAEALAGRKLDLSHVTKADNWIEHLKWEAEWRAALKYIRADAMLRARERGQESNDDEAWFGAQATKGCLHRDADGMSWASCEVENRIIAAGGSTRAAAIRALRAKVEGGGQ